MPAEERYAKWAELAERRKKAKAAKRESDRRNYAKGREAQRIIRQVKRQAELDAEIEAAKARDAAGLPEPTNRDGKQFFVRPKRARPEAEAGVQDLVMPPTDMAPDPDPAGTEEAKKATGWQAPPIDLYNMRGVSTYRTTDGLPVLFLHYSADPKKDPETMTGAAWRESECKDYPGGLEGPDWLQEMEIRFDVRDTSRVWPDWDKMVQRILCSPTDVRKQAHWPLFCGYDYGYPAASALVVLAWADEDTVYQVDEIYGTYTIGQMSALLKKKPYYSRIRRIYADPAIWARTQQTGGVVGSIAQIFEDEYQIFMERGQKFTGVDSAFVTLLESLWAEGAVRFRIASDCTNTLKELRLLAWRESPRQRDMKDAIGQIANKNVHAFDALKYILLERWHAAALPETPAEVGSVDYLISQMEMQRDSIRYVL